jgi:hypothetical protein
MTICDSHDLRPLSSLSFTDFRAPSFRGRESRVDEGFCYVYVTSALQACRKKLHDPLHNASPNPLLESTMAGLK